MTNPTRAEIIEAQIARQWAERNKACEVSSPEIQAAANFILSHIPAPTMAEVEWDDEKHYLAEATHLVYETVLMLGQDSYDAIKFLALNRADSKTVWGQPRDLTPTGRRYTLTEAQE